MDRRDRLGIALLIAALALYAAHLAVLGDYVVDDSYISYRYAENLAAGSGLVFNEGERVEGYSNLTWVLLLAAADRLGFPVPESARVLGILFGALTLAVTTLAAVRLGPDPVDSGAPPGGRGPVPLAGLLLAGFAPFAAWATAGLETAFYTALAATAFLLWLGPRTSRRTLLLGVVLGLLAISRPEGILFAVAAALASALDTSIRFRRVLPLLLIPAAFLTAQVCFRLVYYGDGLPNTFHAKVGNSVAQLRDGLHYLGGFVFGLGWFRVNPAPVPATVAGILRTVAALPLLLLLFAHPLHLRRLAFPLAALLLQALFILAVGGDWMRPYRFLVPVLPALALLLHSGLHGFAGRVTRSIAPSRGPILATATLLTVGLASTALLPAKVYTTHYTDGLKKTSIPFGKELRMRARAGDTIALGDCGALPYYSGLRVIDLYGLMNREIARWKGKATRAEPAAAEIDWIFDAAPRYIVLEISERHPARPGLKGIDRTILAHPRFHAEYAPQPVLAGHFSPAESTLVFERNPAPPPPLRSGTATESRSLSDGS